MTENPHKETILDEIAEVAFKHPKSIAIEQWTGQTALATTYESLWEDAVKLAASLYQREERCVGLEARRSRSFIVGILGIMLGRKAFVPIASDWPKARVGGLRSTLDIRLVLDERAIADAATSRVLQTWKTPRVDKADSAYFICSSGSTGKPKCIDVTHVGIPNLVRNQRACFKSNAESRFLWLLSPIFDGSLSDIFVALSSGSTIVIDESFNESLGFGKTWDIAEERKITHIDIPPVLLRSVLVPARMPACIETLIVGGERLSREVVSRYAPKCRLVNVYGPTEATICTSAKVYSPSNANSEEVTIGSPFRGIRYRLRDEDAGVSELMISGKQLARGYVGGDAAELNAAKFVSDASGVRWFMTGDLASRTAAGEWVVLGRTDRQLKVNGRLVAPEEIEAVAARHDITLAAVLHDGKLRCLAEPPKLRRCSSAQLLEAFRMNLPEWMIPVSVDFVDRLPRLPSGKISYGEVMEMLGRLHGASRTDSKPSASSDEVQETVAQMMADVMGLPSKPGEGLSFKDNLGADSIQHVMLAVKIKGKWGIQLGSADLNGNDTPKKIAELVKSRAFGKDTKPAISLEREALQAEQGILCRARMETSPKRVLVTGAAGFLGSHVLMELLRIGDIEIDCIVKGEDRRHAKSRISEALRRAGIDGKAREIAELRITCHNGDLAKRKFGLDDSVYSRLSGQARMVFHNAGEVNDWKEATELAESNVEAAKNVASFCVEDGCAKLAFASTLSVFASRSDLPRGFICRETPLTSDGILVGGYAQSKWIAEKIVSDVVPPDRLKIMRYGLLTEPIGRQMRLRRNTLNMFLRGARKLGVLPEVDQDLKVDLTPVDIAAKATVDALMVGKCGQSVIHVHAGMQISYGDILDLLASSGGVTKISWRSWKELTTARVSRGSADEDIVACIEALSRIDGFRFGPFDLFQSTDIEFERSGMLQNYSPQDYEREAFAHARYLKQLLRLDAGVNHRDNWQLANT